jgi:hypothetical protein
MAVVEALRWLAAQIALAMTGRYSDASCTQTATTSIAWRT